MNEGCKTQLQSEELSFMSQVTEDDLNLALTPIHTIVWAKKLGKKWKQNASNRALLGKAKKLSLDEVTEELEDTPTSQNHHEEFPS